MTKIIITNPRKGTWYEGAKGAIFEAEMIGCSKVFDEDITFRWKELKTNAEILQEDAKPLDQFKRVLLYYTAKDENGWVYQYESSDKPWKEDSTMEFDCVKECCRRPDLDEEYKNIPWEKSLRAVYGWREKK